MKFERDLAAAGGPTGPVLPPLPRLDECEIWVYDEAQHFRRPNPRISGPDFGAKLYVVCSDGAFFSMNTGLHAIGAVGRNDEH